MYAWCRLSAKAEVPCKADQGSDACVISDVCFNGKLPKSLGLQPCMLAGCVYIVAVQWPQWQI